MTPTSATLLNLNITNKPGLVSTDVIPQALSAHELTSVTVNIKKHKPLPQSRTFRHLANYNKDVLYERLMQEKGKFNQILKTNDADAQISILNDKFIKCLDKCAPIGTKEFTRPSTPWINNELRRSGRTNT